MEHSPQLQLEPVRLEAANESRQQAICDCLVTAGKLDPANVGRALRLQTEQDQWEKIGQILVKLGLTSEHDLAECLSTQLGIRLVLQQDFVEDRPPDDRISAAFLKANRILVLDEDDNALTLVMAEPQDDYARDAVQLCCGKDIVPCLGIPSEIEHELARIYDSSVDSAESTELS